MKNSSFVNTERHVLFIEHMHVLGYGGAGGGALLAEVYKFQRTVSSAYTNLIIKFKKAI